MPRRRERAERAGKVLRALRRLAGRPLRCPSGREPTRIPSEPLEPGASLDDVVRRFDLGVKSHLAGETYRSDVRDRDLGPLIAAVAAAARGRDLRAWIHAGGQVTRLGAAGADEIVVRASRAGRLRLLFSDDRNRLVENVCVDVWKPAPHDSWQAIAADAPVARIRAETPGSGGEERLPVDSLPQFPIDAVYTWVNAADPGWRALVSPYRDGTMLEPERFVQLDELRYSMRSIETYAPWIRRIHVLTNCRPPDWFVPSDRMRWVDHSAAIDERYLPSFNSDAIETFLHRVPDLSEHFVYFNDDFLLADSVFPATFFTSEGRTKAFLGTNMSTLFLAQLARAGEADDWQSGRLNGARLLQERFGVLPTLLHRHAPYALTRSGWQALETEFPSQVEATRRARFRTHEVVTWTAFVYPHYAMLTGSGVLGRGDQYQISTGTMERLSRQPPPAREFAVVAPFGTSANDMAFRAFATRFLERQWPFRSSAEHADA